MDGSDAAPSADIRRRTAVLATGNSGHANVLPHRFKPGQSGNPSGRPRVHKSVRDKALAHAEHALDRLAELIDSDDERIALAACIAILDRALGKPKQPIVDGGLSEAADYSDAELWAIARQEGERNAHASD